MIPPRGALGCIRYPFGKPTPSDRAFAAHKIYCNHPPPGVISHRAIKWDGVPFSTKPCFDVRSRPPTECSRMTAPSTLAPPRNAPGYWIMEFPLHEDAV